MTEIKPKDGILVIKVHKNTQTGSDIVVEDADNDKRLSTGEIIQSGSEKYSIGETIIFGKYALYKLTLKGEDYYFLDSDDVIAICNYKE